MRLTTPILFHSLDQPAHDSIGSSVVIRSSRTSVASRKTAYFDGSVHQRRGLKEICAQLRLDKSLYRLSQV